MIALIPSSHVGPMRPEMIEADMDMEDLLLLFISMRIDSNK